MVTKTRFAGVPINRTLTILLAAGLTSGCGVSKAKYFDLTQSHEQLTSKNQQLQASLDAANQEKALLETSRAMLEGRVKEMEAEVTHQQQSSEDVKTTYESLIGHLKNELSSGKVEIERMRDGISVNLAQEILFPSGSAELDQGGGELLTKLASELTASPFEVLVNGHTDSERIGPTLKRRYPTNWELGAARAARIVRLFEQAGVSKERLSAISLADSRPRESNDTPEGRARNRRIEVRLRPMVNEQTAGD